MKSNLSYQTWRTISIRPGESHWIFELEFANFSRKKNMIFGESLCFEINTTGAISNYSMKVKGGNCAERAMSDFTADQFDFGV